MDVDKTAEALIREAANEARQELYREVSPLIQQAVDAAEQLEKFLRSGNRNAYRSNNRRRRLPRGALQKSIRDILRASPEPQTLTAIRDRLLKQAAFRGRNPRALYTQVIHALRQMPDVERKNGKRYWLQRK